MTAPSSTKYAIIGAGIHGLSTALHLAEMLKASGRGSGEDILVVDKTAIAAGASGIACGVVRNNYFQPAMRELMAHSVDVWESDAESLQLPSGRLHADQPRMHARGCRLDLRAAEGDRLRVRCSSRAPTTSIELHEGPVRRLAGARASPRCCTRSGAATPTTWRACTGSPPRRRAEGVSHPVRRRGARLRVRLQQQRCDRAARHNQGRIACETVVVGVGPWVNQIWNMLELPKRSRSRVATARCITTCRCGNSGAWRKARSASIPSCTRPMTDACRR